MVTLTGMTYATEIPDTAIRGTVCTACALLFTFGNALSVILSLTLTWYTVALSNVVAILVYICLIVPFLPESPTFLIVKEREKQAIKILKDLRGKYIDIETEMSLIKKMNDDAMGDREWSFIREKKVQRSIMVLTILFFVQGFSGADILRADAIRILKASGVSNNADLFNIIFFLVPIVGVLVLSSLADILGRRGCLVMSLTFMMIAYVVLGTIVYFQNQSIPQLVTVQLNDTGQLQSHQMELR